MQTKVARGYLENSIGVTAVNGLTDASTGQAVRYVGLEIASPFNLMISLDLCMAADLSPN